MHSKSVLLHADFSMIGKGVPQNLGCVDILPVLQRRGIA